MCEDDCSEFFTPARLLPAMFPPRKEKKEEEEEEEEIKKKKKKKAKERKRRQCSVRYKDLKLFTACTEGKYFPLSLSLSLLFYSFK